MPFVCTICEEESTRICFRCTKDTCGNHLCEKCARCSDCCDCEVKLNEVRGEVREDDPEDDELEADELEDDELGASETVAMAWAYASTGGSFADPPDPAPRDPDPEPPLPEPEPDFPLEEKPE